MFIETLLLMVDGWWLVAGGWCVYPNHQPPATNHGF